MTLRMLATLLILLLGAGNAVLGLLYWGAPGNDRCNLFNVRQNRRLCLVNAVLFILLALALGGMG